MLSSIKDKLLSVFNNDTNKNTQLSKSLNFNAGSAILTHFQQEWKILHANNEENAKKADEVAKTMSAITNRIQNDKDHFGLMTHIIVNSNLKSNIIQCTQQLERIYTNFENVEQELSQLENLIEEIEFEELKKTHRLHQQQFKERKEESLKSLETLLQEKYNKAVIDSENGRKREMEEKQQIYQAAFANDMEVFKAFGTIPRSNLPKKQPSALLEEIQISDNENELDQFFTDNS